MTPEFYEKEHALDKAAMVLAIAFKDLDFVEPMESAELKLTHADGSRYEIIIKKI